MDVSSFGGMSRSRLRSTKTRTSSSPPLFRTITWIFIVFCTAFLAFYAGVWTGLQAGPAADVRERQTIANLPGTELEQKRVEERVEALVRQKLKSRLEELCENLPSSVSQDKVGGGNSNSNSNKRNNSGGSGNPLAATADQIASESQRKTKVVSPLFSNSIAHFAQGLVRVAKDDLMQTFDFGVPPNPGTQGLDALILYNKREAMPSDPQVAKAARYEDPTQPLPKVSAETATQNCDTMNVVFANNPGNTRQCFALVGSQYQSYHVHRWMRRKDSGGIDPKMPLKLTSRAWTAAGFDHFYPPKELQVKTHEARLLTYLKEVGNMKSRLKQILAKMGQRTVVVMTCNHGQSELLMNFACSARARGFDLKNVLVFPTDQETEKLATGMGLITFYEENMMTTIPKHEAKLYGDGTFASVMFAKVLCVQLVNELGYDLLFQDADVVWYKNPLDYFHDKTLPQFDTYFQDDGSRQERYAPYSANSGFYFVRSNAKTRHLFRHFIYSSDLIDAWRSHQQVLIALLAEHSSVTGLSVKIFPKETEEFMGGLHFHNKKEAVRKIVTGNSKAYIFHMSWTENKDNKLKFFQQMGDWYLKEQCIGKEAHDITDEKVGTEMSEIDGVLTTHCCSAEPLVKCHYRDKPSKIPCRDSPLIDRKGIPFW